MKLFTKNTAVFVLMLASSGLAIALKPHIKIADMYPPVKLEQMIPEQFGDWTVDRSLVSPVVSADIQAKLDLIYNQTLSRTYINSKGKRIMLSIAYGGDQSDSTQLHRPEVCYVAQGFQVNNKVVGSLESGFGTIPVKRLMATQGPRQEPITYWISIGEHVITSNSEQKWVQLQYGLRGRIPDGFLVRVSTITEDTEAGYLLEASFAKAMLAGMLPQNRVRLSSNSVSHANKVERKG